MSNDRQTAALVLGLALSLVVGFTIGRQGRGSRSTVSALEVAPECSAIVISGATEFPLSPLERQVARDLKARVAAVREGIAVASSGDAELAGRIYRIVAESEAIHRDDEELRREAEVARGEVALVRSTNPAWWVVKNR